MADDAAKKYVPADRYTNKKSTFISSYAYSTKNDDNVISHYYEVGFCPNESVAEIIDDRFQQQAIISLSELFCPYKAIIDGEGVGSSGIPEADFSEREAGFAGSGYARPEIVCSDLQSGVNYGICPTYGEERQDRSDEIFDKNDMQDIRSVGFKLPMMVAGFGFTTEGMPFPSRFDEQTKDDEDYDPDDETKSYDRHQFSSRTRDRMDLWKAGPLDIRWDEYRSMYVAAPENFIGYAMGDIPASSGRYADKTFTSGEIELSIGRYDDYHTPSGEIDVKSTTGGTTTTIKRPFPGHKLLIINRSVSMDIPSGALVIATRLNNGEYMPIFADCAPDLEE